MAMCLLHERIDAETAERWGLVYKTVDDGALDATVAEMAAKIAALSPDAATAVRNLIANSFEKTLDEQLQRERDYQAKLTKSPAFAASVAKFGKGRA
jgi:2-(1,2-epoxy-1,2-dihydrophenyl)acetyl-CoA isomerase